MYGDKIEHPKPRANPLTIWPRINNSNNWKYAHAEVTDLNNKMLSIIKMVYPIIKITWVMIRPSRLRCLQKNVTVKAPKVADKNITLNIKFSYTNYEKKDLPSCQTPNPSSRWRIKLYFIMLLQTCVHQLHKYRFCRIERRHLIAHSKWSSQCTNDDRNQSIPRHS